MWEAAHSQLTLLIQTPIFDNMSIVNVVQTSTENKQTEESPTEDCETLVEETDKEDCKCKSYTFIFNFN